MTAPAAAPVQVRPAQAPDLAAWAAMRHALWPDADVRALSDEARAMLEGRREAAFIAVRDGVPVGMAEASLRREYVNGTGSSPVGFLEGWYVVPEWRARVLPGARAARRFARSKDELARLLRDAGARVVQWRHSARFFSRQTFVVARKDAR